MIFTTQFLLIILLGLMFFTTLCAGIIMSKLKGKHKITLYWLSGLTTILLILLALGLKL